MAEAGPSDPLSAAKEANQIRFEQDLEFLQSLANPFFVRELTLNGTLTSEPMLNYLKHLRYFQAPSYARFVRYPLSLAVLDLLTVSEASAKRFAAEMSRMEVASEWAERLLAAWAASGGKRTAAEATV